MTGVGQGIGKAIALGLADTGATVVVVARTASDASPYSTGETTVVDGGLTSETSFSPTSGSLGRTWNKICSGITSGR